MRKRRPALKYFGSKWRISNWIISHFPEHGHYIEPCFGAGSVLLQKPPVKLETANDIDDRVINFFSQLRDNSEELIRIINLTPWHENEYDICKQRADNKIEDARRYFVACWMSINGGPLFTGFRTQSKVSSRYSVPPKDISNHDLEFISDRLKNVQFISTDAIDVIKKFGADGDALIYFDPPYLKELRSSKSGYGDNEVERQFHIDAANELNKCKSSAVVSGFNSKLYSKLYSGWTRVDKTGSFASLNKTRTESIWIKKNSV